VAGSTSRTLFIGLYVAVIVPHDEHCIPNGGQACRSCPVVLDRKTVVSCFKTSVTLNVEHSAVILVTNPNKNEWNPYKCTY
jgi:hypothetical protein